MPVKIKIPTLKSLKQNAKRTVTKYYVEVNKLLKEYESKDAPASANLQFHLDRLIKRYTTKSLDTIDSYFKHKGTVTCPKCKKKVDTVIVSNFSTRCPFCVNLNWLDLVSTVGKTPEGASKTVAFSCHIKDPKHKENNMVIKGPRQSLLYWILNKISFGKIKKRYSRFGYLKIYANPGILKNAKEFDKKYLVVVGATPKELIVKYFGDVQMTVTKQVEDMKKSR